MLKLGLGVVLPLSALVTIAPLARISAQDSGAVKSTQTTVPGPEGKSLTAERGTLTLPLRHDRRDGQKVELAFVRIRSTAKQPGPPIFLLAGGPGSSGIDMLRTFAKESSHLLAFGDLVGIDQRGTGESKPNLRTSVSWSAPLDKPADRKTWAASLGAAIEKATQQCRDKKIDVDAFNTIESAHDLDAARKALGYEKIILWGASYGTHLALATIRYHGDVIARSVMISPEGPDHSLKLPSQIQDCLERLSVLVSKDEKLWKDVPDLVGMTREVLRRLAAKPITVEVGTQSVGIGKFDVQMLLSSMLGRRRTMSLVPAVVAMMHEGDFAQVARQLMRRRRGQPIHVMPIVMDASSGVSDRRLAQVADEDRWCILGSAVNFPYPDIIKTSGFADCGAAFRSELRTDVPVLMITGELDCKTPVRNARELLASMPKGHLIIVEHGGHGAPYLRPALRQAIERFLRGEAPGISRFAHSPLRFMSPAQMRR